jgi:hypothetical protein
MSNTKLLDLAIPAAGTVVTASPMKVGNAEALIFQAAFDYGSGGTTVKAYVQTSVDRGTTWIDIACFAFATADAKKVSKVLIATALTPVTAPTDGTLTDDTVLDGVIGDRLRVKTVVVGTYAASTLAIWAEAK